MIEISEVAGCCGAASIQYFPFDVDYKYNKKSREQNIVEVKKTILKLIKREQQSLAPRKHYISCWIAITNQEQTIAAEVLQSLGFANKEFFGIHPPTTTPDLKFWIYFGDFMNYKEEV